MPGRLVFEQDDGTVAVVIPAPGWTLEQVRAKDCPQDREVLEVAEGALPADREFRGAWRISGGQVRENLAAARAIARDRDPDRTAKINAAGSIAALKALRVRRPGAVAVG